MNNEEFNFFKLGKCEKDVVLPALREVHTNLWDRKFPTKPWQWNEASVKCFEQEEEQIFETRIKDKSKNEKKKERNKRKDKKYKIRGDDNGGDIRAKWISADWDICKLCHAIVDSKLFKLEEVNMQLSNHIVSLRDIRNKTAHFTAYAISNEILADSVKEITDHINGLTCIIKTEHYLNIIQEIKKSQKPESHEQQAKLKLEYEALKHLCQLHAAEQELSEMRLLLLQEKDENEKQRSEYKEEIAKVKKDLEQEKENLGKKLQQERDKNAKLEETFQRDNENKKQKTKGKIDQLNKQKESMENALKMSQQENQAKGEEIIKMKDEIIKMKDEIAKLKRCLEQEQRDNKNQAADILKMKDELSELKKQKLELEFEIKSKEKNMQSLEVENSNLNKQNSSLIERNNHQKGQMSQMLNKNYDLKQKVNTSLVLNNNQSRENKNKDREILKLKEENENLNRRLCKSKIKKDIQVKNLEKVKEENKGLKWANKTAQTIIFEQTEQENELKKENHMLRQKLEQVFETLANDLFQSSKISMQDRIYNTLQYFNDTYLKLKSNVYENSENSQERENMKIANFQYIGGNSIRPSKDQINNNDYSSPINLLGKTVAAVDEDMYTQRLHAHRNTNTNSVSEQMSTSTEKCNQLETEKKQVQLRLRKAESKAEKNETEMLKMQDTVSRLVNKLHNEENKNVGILEKLRTETELRKNAERQSNEYEEEINHLKHELIRLKRENQRPRDLPEDSSITEENAHLREQLRKMKEKNSKMEEKLKHAEKMLHSQIAVFFDRN